MFQKISLSHIPKRSKKPRHSGLTMVMDKGLSLHEVENMLSIGGIHIDYVKLGFGTAFVTPDLDKKVALYHKYHIPLFLGGTLFEAFYIRGQVQAYIDLCKDLRLEVVEISDGSIEIAQQEKCKIITRLAKEFTVLSEVGSKDAEQIMPPYQWIELMQSELQAGASYVIAEAREAGNVGIYRNSGEVRQGLVQEILTKIPFEKIIWEAPQKSQQLFFLKLLGCNVNLGNIAPIEVLALEAMRIGLRGDSFYFYLPKHLQVKK